MDEEQKITLPLDEYKAYVEKAAKFDEHKEYDKLVADLVGKLKDLLPNLFPGAFPQPAPPPTATFSSSGSSMPVPTVPYSDPIEELKRAVDETKEVMLKIYAELKPKDEPPKVDEKDANEKVGKVLRSLEKP